MMWGLVHSNDCDLGKRCVLPMLVLTFLYSTSVVGTPAHVSVAPTHGDDNNAVLTRPTSSSLSVWPMPTTASMTDDPCLSISTGSFKFKTHSTSAILQRAMVRYQTLMFLPGAPTQPCTSTSATDVAVTFLSIVLQSNNETLGPSTAENYTLTINTQTATLTAASVYGALHGLETFAQLVFSDSSENHLIPSVKIEDTPRFGFRAIMIDTARLFRPVSLLKKMMDAMASTKLNALYLHLTDDNCWPVEILSYPLLTTNCSQGCNLDGKSSTGRQFYSQVDLRDLVSYAGDRGIRVIPEIDSPGHFNTEHCYPNILTVADYPCSGAGPGNGTFFGPPDPSNPALWKFFQSMYGELNSLFPDTYVSLGGDEAWLTPWTCSPTVGKWMSAHNFSVSEAAQYYEQQLYAIATANNKRTLMWAPGQSTPSNTTIHVVWTGWPQNGPPDAWKRDFASFTAQGQSVVLSGPWYLDPAHPDWCDWKDWYHTDPSNFSSASVRASAQQQQPEHLLVQQQKHLVLEQQEHLVLGGMGTIWSDLVKEEIVSQAWPLMNALAEQLWSSSDTTSLPGAPTSRYLDQCTRLQQRGILNATGCIPPPPPPPPSPPSPSPPPPPPVPCSPHVGVKLNNTQYADGNGPRTTTDADACCQLCAHTNNCNHWSFQIDASVAGKVCHWATLTYCCWLHAQGDGAITVAGWTSDVDVEVDDVIAALH